MHSRLSSKVNGIQIPEDMMLTWMLAMIKMFHARRNPEPGQKKQVIQASKMLADIMIKHLTPLDFSAYRF